MTPTQPQVIEIESVFKLMLDGFSRAAATRSTESMQASYTLAGKPVRLHVVGNDLADWLDQAYAHLRLKSAKTVSEPALTIELWDQNATGVKFYQRRAESGQNLNLHPVLTHSADGRLLAYQMQSSIVCLDRADRRLVGCVTSVEALSLYELGRPLHVPLTCWHNDIGIPVVHAGLVSSGGKGMLLAGAGGSGKSSTALACMLAGFDFASDDLIGLEVAEDGPITGHSLYNSTYVDSGHLERFPMLQPLVTGTRYEYEKKELVLLSKAFGSRLTASADLHCVLLPRIMGGEAPSRIHPAPKSKALLALGPSSRAVNQTMGVAGMEKLIRVVDRLPCYWVDLGCDSESIASKIKTLL